ncbi:sugar 3,4-ketoisomerase [Taibaiella soli]|uniref:WxcM-like domain-containing protein n=1 Tax=Taibaiella soli TaxID=1649169 RepID=A0A2W2A9K1_9BACT|nr:FdtA/QdtA family cupin domain-containing protein [Taibaiella soli]PZF72045.1 WxcM-like domain-containing protein [Taibaiella soli]
MSLELAKIINLPKILDDRGNLSFFQNNGHIPFEIKRVYWIYDVPGGETRGGHAYNTLQEFIVALSGSFDVVLNDGKNKKTYTLNRSNYGLYVPNRVWRHMENFSTNSVAFIAADQPYNASEYIRDFQEFQKKTQ